MSAVGFAAGAMPPARTDMSKELMLGARLRYPITITKLLKRAGDTIKKQEPVLQYSFKWRNEVGDQIRGETWMEEVTTTADWDSPADGTVREWRLREGQQVKGDGPVLLVEESCSHEVQFQGLCALCGLDMTLANWASPEHLDTERAPINMTHDQTSLTVSATRAVRAEEELQRRLLRSRRLSLVVDLDQTIIHACIEPTIGEWQRDPSSPNYPAVRDVQAFQLSDDGVSGSRGMASLGCWYYIKMRPGLAEFLEHVSALYELHVYTMGTRAYALNIARIVDPKKKLFGNRVISRDENGSLTAKSLQRLFPVSTSMVVIIDDRSDVWPRNRKNLIKVTPYDFFKGIGDINSSFLPPRQDNLQPGGFVDAAQMHQAQQLGVPLQPQLEGSTATEQLQEEAGEAGEASKAADMVRAQLAAPTDQATGLPVAGEDLTLRRLQVEEQERLFERQLKDRPLLHMQEELDKEDDSAAAAVAAGALVVVDQVEASNIQTGDSQGPTDQGQSDDSNTPADISPDQQLQAQAQSVARATPQLATHPTMPPPSRHNLLRDDDEELKFLQRHLTLLHQAFYEEYDKRREQQMKEAAAARETQQKRPSGRTKRPNMAKHGDAATKSPTISTARPSSRGSIGGFSIDTVMHDNPRRMSRSSAEDESVATTPAATDKDAPKDTDDGPVDFTAVPDVGRVLDRLKSGVLSGTVIVLSGLVPLGADVHRSELGLQVMSFGAKLETRVGPRTTHLVVAASRPRTQKVRQAARFLPDIAIVGEGWLAECMRTWVWADEGPYMIDVPPPPPLTHKQKEPAANSRRSASPAESDAASKATTVVPAGSFSTPIAAEEEREETASIPSDEDDSDEENRAPKTQLPRRTSASGTPPSPVVDDGALLEDAARGLVGGAGGGQQLRPLLPAVSVTPPPSGMVSPPTSEPGGVSGGVVNQGTGERMMLDEEDEGDLDVDGDEEDEDDEDDEPTEQDGGGGDQSPIDDLKTFDWGEADDEMKEFLGSDEEDEEEDGDGGGDGDAKEEGEGGDGADGEGGEDGDDGMDDEEGGESRGRKRAATNGSSTHLQIPGSQGARGTKRKGLSSGDEGRSTNGTSTPTDSGPARTTLSTPASKSQPPPPTTSSTTPPSASAAATPSKKQRLADRSRTPTPIRVGRGDSGNRGGAAAGKKESAAAAGVNGARPAMAADKSATTQEEDDMEDDLEAELMAELEAEENM